MNELLRYQHQSLSVDGKVLNDSKWDKKGILKVKYVIDEDGELRYNNIKHKINNQAEIYLKLLKIKKQYPRCGMEKLKQ